MATRINREALRQRIKELAGLSDDERAQLLELVNTKKYGLVWENHPEAVEERLRTHLPVLDEVPERYIPGATTDAPNHILIEGDNLEALTALTYTHEGRIDVIYIDPPYNTGNKDFVYNDKYVDADDDYRHSKWLSFMSKRLRIAKRLLSDRGVIFISIDDNEQANLKLLCDEVFGMGNFLADEIWQKKKGGSNDSRHIAVEHEYIMFYARNKDKLNDIFIPYEESYLSRYKEEDEIGRYFWDTFKRKSGKQYYAITCPDGTIIEKEENGEPISWLRSKQRFLSDLKKGETRIIKLNNKWAVHFKQRMPEGYKPRSIINDKGTTSTGADEIKEIFNSAFIFNNPKPTTLIKYMLQFGHSRNSTILDFFAGSGTTMHAVMQLNKEDGGHRQCILVTNNENNICEEVTYVRNKRVIEGYTTPKGVEVEGLTDNSLRYYRTRLLPRQRTNRNMRDLMAAATDLLCIKEDIFEEQEIKNLAIRNIRKHVRLFGKGSQYMLIIYNEEAIPRIVQWLKTTPPTPIDATTTAPAQSPLERGTAIAGGYVKEGWPKTGVCLKPIKVYTFSYTNYAYDDDFAEVEDRVQLCALPAAIYEAYRRVLPQEDRYYDNEIIDGSNTNEGKEDNQ